VPGYIRLRSAPKPFIESGPVLLALFLSFQRERVAYPAQPAQLGTPISKAADPTDVVQSGKHEAEQCPWGLRLLGDSAWLRSTLAKLRRDRPSQPWANFAVHCHIGR